MDALHPWLEYKAPFHLCGNLYHVGGTCSPSYLLDTDDGLLLIDTGFPKTGYFLIQNIHELGFDPRNIRWILHSHGHFDHFGCTRALQEFSGAKTYLGAEDREIANGTLPLSWAEELGTAYDEAFEPDVLLRDGDTLTFGNVTIQCIATPGHTGGAMGFFFDLQENGKTYRAGTHGGVGFNSMKSEFLKKYGLDPVCRDRFLASLDRLKLEKVDVFYGNHLWNNRTDEKLAARAADPAGPNPFIDPAEWEIFLTQTRRDFLDFIQNDPVQ